MLNFCFREGPFPMGCTQLKVPLKLVRKISKTASISPCGVAFVKAKKREGVLPRMLREILETRLMVI
jgi:DNA polymerase zeta